MGGKGVVKKIRRINKGKKPHEPVYDPELLPPGSIIAVDISTILVPFVKSNEGAAQANAMPKQSVTSVIDKLEVIYIKKVAPFRHKLLCVVDASFSFKDQVVRHKRIKIATNAAQQLAAARKVKVFSDALIKKVRRAEKNVAKVTCDVISNLLQWTQRRPGITAVKHCGICSYLLARLASVYIHACPCSIFLYVTLYGYQIYSDHDNH